jgi:hypothetical protein
LINERHWSDHARCRDLLSMAMGLAMSMMWAWTFWSMPSGIRSMSSQGPMADLMRQPRPRKVTLRIGLSSGKAVMSAHPPSAPGLGQIHPLAPFVVQGMGRNPCGEPVLLAIKGHTNWYLIETEVRDNAF